jgi:transposase
MAGLAVTRGELTAGDLRRAAARAENVAAARRMLALALVLEGASRAEAARAAGMDRQTLRDWVHRYNAEGLDGLNDRPRPGRPPTLTAAQQAELVALVEAGPDPVRDKLVRWRRADLAAVIQARWGVALAERSVGALLNRQGYKKLSVRPQHPEVDDAAQAAFKKTSPALSPRPSPSAPKARPSRSGSRTRRASASRAR